MTGHSRARTLMDAAWKHCKGWLFRLFPHHLVSRITFWATRLRIPLKNPAIRLFIRTFDVDMHEACHAHPEDYASFDDFFTRQLVPGARPIAPGANVIVSPADGRISQVSDYASHRAIQAKGRWFSMRQLLGGVCEYGRLCERGNFATIYLSPRDYHRVHMPFDGVLKEMVYVPGRLFSVAPYSAEVVDNLYTRNERVISIFETELGWMAVVMVGAVNVAAIELAWEGRVTPARKRTLQRKQYPGVKLNKGDELGIFHMGSTAIIAFESPAVEWDAGLRKQQPVKMGQRLGSAGSTDAPRSKASRSKASVSKAS